MCKICRVWTLKTFTCCKVSIYFQKLDSIHPRTSPPRFGLPQRLPTRVELRLANFSTNTRTRFPRTRGTECCSNIFLLVQTSSHRTTATEPLNIGVFKRWMTAKNECNVNTERNHTTNDRNLATRQRWPTFAVLQAVYPHRSGTLRIQTCFFPPS